MVSSRPNRFHGIYTATICPMAASGAIDEAALAAHLVDAVATDGIVGVLINGHAGEFPAHAGGEEARGGDARGEIGERAILVCGINTESSLVAADHARRRGRWRDVLLVFPPFSWALSQDATMAVNHHHVAAASKLPLMLYQAGVGTREMARSDAFRAGACRMSSASRREAGRALRSQSAVGQAGGTTSR